MKKNDKITVITCAAAFALNVALFSVKLYVGLCANSISIYSDAVNNMFDSLSGLAAFICFAALLSSSSEGTRAIIKKAEQFFSFVMSVIILLTGLYFAYNSLERLFYPTPISYLTRYLVMLIVTVAVKFVMFFAYRGVYRITGLADNKSHGGGQHSRLLHNPRHGHESHRLAVCRVCGRRRCSGLLSARC